MNVNIALYILPNGKSHPARTEHYMNSSARKLADVVTCIHMWEQVSSPLEEHQTGPNYFKITPPSGHLVISEDHGSAEYRAQQAIMLSYLVLMDRDYDACTISNQQYMHLSPPAM
jgi:hypothetical protein